MADPLATGGTTAQGASAAGGTLAAIGGAGALGVIGLTLFGAGAIAAPILGFFAAKKQADAIREQARRERGAVEENIGLRFLDAERRASTLRARAGASGVAVGGSPRVAEHQIFAYERMQEDIAISNANARLQMANKAAKNIMTGAALNLAFGEVGAVGGILAGAYGLAKDAPQYSPGSSTVVPSNLMQPMSPLEATTFYGAAPGMGGSQGLTGFQLPASATPRLP